MSPNSQQKHTPPYSCAKPKKNFQAPSLRGFERVIPMDHFEGETKIFDLAVFEKIDFEISLHSVCSGRGEKSGILHFFVKMTKKS